MRECVYPTKKTQKQQPVNSPAPETSKDTLICFGEKGYQAYLSVSARHRSSHLEPFCMASPRPTPRGVSLREAVGQAESRPGRLAGRWQDRAAGWILLAAAVCRHLGHFGSRQAKSGRCILAQAVAVAPPGTKYRKIRSG